MLDNLSCSLQPYLFCIIGCPLYLPKVEVYDKLEPLSQKEKELLCDKLFFTLNWFREVVNAFATQSDPEMKAKVITRLHNVTELQGYLEKCLNGKYILRYLNLLGR